MGISLRAIPVVSAVALAASTGLTPLQAQVASGLGAGRLPPIESAAPVTIVTREEIEDSGTIFLEDILNQLPQIVSGQSQQINNGASGTVTLNLRNLGNVRNLLTVDGGRLPIGDPFAAAPDLDQVPAALIDRIEIAHGAVGARYGANAGSGTVNVVLARDLEGFRVTGQVGGFWDNNGNDIALQTNRASPATFPIPDDRRFDGEQIHANIAWGTRFAGGRGRFIAYGGYRYSTPILAGDRDIANCALGQAPAAPNGLSCAINTTTNPTSFIVLRFGPGGDAQNVGTSPILDGMGGLRPLTVADRFNFAQQDYILRRNERYQFGAIAELELDGGITPYAEFHFSNNEARAQLATTGTFSSNSITFRCANPLLPDGVAQGFGCTDFSDTSAQTFDIAIGRRFVEFGTGRRSDYRHRNWRGVAGLRGALAGGWHFDLSANYAVMDYANRYSRDVLPARLDQALQVVAGAGGPQCAPGSDAGCVPLNVFVPNGVTQAALDFITVPAFLDGRTTLFEARANGRRDFANPFGADDPLRINFGVAFRRETLSLDADALFEAGSLAGVGGPTADIPRGGISVLDVHAGASLPVITWGGGGLTFDAAWRYSDHSRSGGVHNFQVAARLEAVDGLSFRAVYGRTGIEPPVAELVTPQVAGLFAGFDPCAGPTPTATQAQCLTQGVSAAQYGSVPRSAANQYGQLTGGNPDLDHEIATSFTAGVALDGRALGVPSLRLSADYVRFDIDDTIAQIGAQRILNQCVATGSDRYCALISRGAGGSLLSGAGFVVNTPQNIAGLRYEGIDLAASLELPVGPGRIALSYVGTLLLRNAFQLRPELGFSDCAGYFGNVCGNPDAEYRHRMTAGFAGNGWGATVRWRHTGPVTNDVESDDPVLAFPAGRGGFGNRLLARDYFDLSAYVEPINGLRLIGGVQNIFGTDPPIVPADIAGGFSNGNTYPGTYDALGRRLYLRVQISL